MVKILELFPFSENKQKSKTLLTCFGTAKFKKHMWPRKFEADWKL